VDGLMTKKKILFFSLSAIIVVFIIIGGIYIMHRFYFTGQVNEYMAAQKIPKSRIVKRQTTYNYMQGMWKCDVVIKSKGRKLTYEYVTVYPDSLTLSITDTKTENALDTSQKQIKQLEYPPLKYDQ
jgi:uncharacterized protein YxeA